MYGQAPRGTYVKSTKLSLYMHVCEEERHTGRRQGV